MTAANSLRRWSRFLRRTAGQWNRRFRNRFSRICMLRMELLIHSIIYSQAAADTYTAALNKAAAELEGKTNVYSILVPNNSGVMLSEEELEALGGADQQQAIRVLLQSDGRRKDGRYY